MLNKKHNNIKNELLAYDLIGIQYYYLGEIEKASHYHNRMVFSLNYHIFILNFKLYLKLSLILKNNDH